MQGEVYIQTYVLASGNFTYSHISTRDLLLTILCRNQVGYSVQTAVRELARQIGRSAGAITPALRRLIADGWIAVSATVTGSVITILRSIGMHHSGDQESDRSVFGAECSETSNEAPACEIAESAGDQESDRDQGSDRVCMNKVLVSSKEEEEESDSAFLASARGVAAEKPMTGDPLYAELITHAGMNARLAERIARNPIGTVKDFIADLEKAKRTSGIDRPFWFVVARWRDGQRVEAPRDTPPSPPCRGGIKGGVHKERESAPIDTAAYAADPAFCDSGSDLRTRAEEVCGPITPETIRTAAQDCEYVMRLLASGIDESAAASQLADRRALAERRARIGGRL